MNDELEEKRMIIAMLAMQGLLASTPAGWQSEILASQAVRCADALLAALEKPR